MGVKGNRKKGRGNARCYTILFHQNNSDTFVEVHESEMDGWLLFECFFLPSYEVCYFTWNDEETVLEWMNLAKEEITEKEKILGEELGRRKACLVTFV